MTGVLADVNIEGHVNYLMALVRAAPWADLWEELGLKYLTFGDVGLDREASDAEVWRVCQEVVVSLLRVLIGMDELRGTGRLYLP